MTNTITIKTDNPHDPMSDPKAWGEHFLEQIYDPVLYSIGMSPSMRSLTPEVKQKITLGIVGLLSMALPLGRYLAPDGKSHHDFLISIIRDMAKKRYV